MREWKTVLCTLIAANNGYLLPISLVLMKRSIIQLLLPTVPKIYGICQHQSILIPVDYIALPGLKFFADWYSVLLHNNTHGSWRAPNKPSNCTIALGKPTKFQICPGAILNYLFLWIWIVMYGSLSTGKSYRNFNMNILECHQQLPLREHTLWQNNKSLLNVGPIEYCIEWDFLLQPSS